MNNRDAELTDRKEFFLKPGHIVLWRSPAIIYIVLGSSVTVSLWERKKRFAALCHYQYPVPAKKNMATARYGMAALSYMYMMLVSEGAQEKFLEAQIFGGADRGGTTVGAENVRLAKGWLEKQGIEIVSMDVGGIKGRKVVYNVQNNEAIILKADRIRTSDWYPYIDTR